jgi:HAMP domain-containing protein
MPKPEREAVKYKEAKLQFVWAPLITAVAGLVTAVVLHFVTDSKLGNASSNFSKLSDSLAAMQVEAKVNREELDRLEHLVDQILDNLLARRDPSVPTIEHSEHPLPGPVPEPVAKLQDIKQQIAAARLRTSQQLQLNAVPKTLFDK